MKSVVVGNDFCAVGKAAASGCNFCAVPLYDGKSNAGIACIGGEPSTLFYQISSSIDYPRCSITNKICNISIPHHTGLLVLFSLLGLLILFMKVLHHKY